MKKAIRIFTISLIIVLTLATVAFAGIPEKSDSFYVADYAKVIDSDTEDYIVQKNGDLEAACGGQIVVVTVDFLDGMDIEDYAYKIFNDWEIGSKENNNGVLLLLAIGEENYWCMQGKGLENKITADDIDDMLWNYLEDDFASGDYDAGVRSFFDEMYSEVSSYYAKDTGEDDFYFDYEGTAEMVDIFTKIVIVLVVLFIFIVLLNITNTGRSAKRYTPYETSYPRKRKSRPIIFGGSRPSSRPSRPSGSMFSSSSRPSRSSSSSRSSRPSRPSRPSGGGGGGRSRGGGAGRRGR